jgi:hypothetical protein
MFRHSRAPSSGKFYVNTSSAFELVQCVKPRRTALPIKTHVTYKNVKMIKQWTKSFLSSIYAVIRCRQFSPECKWKSRGSNPKPKSGRVLTERRTCTLKGVELPKHVGRTLCIDYVFFYVHEMLVRWVVRLMLCKIRKRREDRRSRNCHVDT